jgi:DNA-directed RNA polymerase sigma subunit (sigma70/sigma32)
MNDINNYEKIFHQIVQDKDAQPPENLIDSVNYALNFIDTELRIALIDRYGLNSHKPHTYKQLAEEHNITFDVARGRCERGLRMMRKPQPYHVVKYGR